MKGPIGPIGPVGGSLGPQNAMAMANHGVLQALKYVDESFYRERDFMVEAGRAVAIGDPYRPILFGEASGNQTWLAGRFPL